MLLFLMLRPPPESPPPRLAEVLGFFFAVTLYSIKLKRDILPCCMITTLTMSVLDEMRLFLRVVLD